MTTVLDLRVGDEVQGWMKTGFALQQNRTATGTVYFSVPTRPDRFDRRDISKFIGLVLQNNTSTKVLVCAIHERNRWSQAVGESFTAEIPYATLQTLRRFSKMTYPGKPVWNRTPGYGMKNHAYRTVENVELIW